MSNIVKGINTLKDKSGAHDILMNPSGAMNTVNGVELMRSYGVAKGSSQLVDGKYSELGNKNHTISFVAKIDIKYIDSFFDSIFSYGSEYANGHYDVRVSGGFVMDYVPDNSLPEDHRAGFGEPIIALKEIVLGAGQRNTFPAGYLLHGAGSGGANNSLQRMEDPNNPRDKPYESTNQNTGTWSWKDVATTRGVEWQYAKEAQVDGDVETGEGVIGLSTNYDLSVYTLEIDRELMLLSLYKNGAPLKQYIPLEDRIEANERINLFSNVARDQIMHSQFGEMVILPKINQDERKATEYYLLNKWNIGALVDLDKPSYGYQGSGMGVWEGSRIYPSILREGSPSIFMKDQGMIAGVVDTAGEYIKDNTLTGTSMLARIEPNLGYSAQKTGGRWLYRHKNEPDNGWFWESRQAGDMLYLHLGYVFRSNVWLGSDGIFTTITSTQRPFSTSSAELPQWVLDGYFETTSDGQLFFDNPIYKIEKSIDWLQNNHNNRITIEIDSVTTEYIWRQEEFDLVFTDVFGTHQRRTYNGNLCIISQRYDINDQPKGLEIDGIRGFYNTETDKIEGFVRQNSGGISTAIISVVINDDQPSDVIAVCDDIIDPSDVVAGWSPAKPDQLVLTRLTPIQPSPVSAQNMLPKLVSDVSLGITPVPPIQVLISEVVIESTEDISLTMIRLPEGQDILADSANYQQTKDNLYLGKYEVTQRLWYGVLGGALPDDYREDHPIRNKTWDEVNTFLDALNESEKNAGNLPNDWAYVLPSTRSWEYACRAGIDGNYNWDGDWDTSKANFRPTSTSYGAVYRNDTVSVTSFSPNAWGFHNMHGNVGEWTVTTYQEWNQATNSWGNRKYIMGGGYKDYPSEITSSSFRLLSAGDRNWDVGFRLELRKYESTPVPPLSPQDVSTKILVNTPYYVYHNDTAETSGYYYPVYEYNFGIGDHHTHVIDGITYYMPDEGATHAASSPPNDLEESPYQAFAVYGKIYFYKSNTGLYDNPTNGSDKYHYPARLAQSPIMSDTAYLSTPSGSSELTKVWFPKYENMILNGAYKFGITPSRESSSSPSSYIKFGLTRNLLVEYNGYTGTNIEQLSAYGEDGLYGDDWDISEGTQWVDTFMGRLSKRYRFIMPSGTSTTGVHDLILNVISYDKFEFTYRYTRTFGGHATAELNPVAIFEKVENQPLVLDAGTDGSYLRYNT